jgi:hypothetical protein
VPRPLRRWLVAAGALGFVGATLVAAPSLAQTAPPPNIAWAMPATGAAPPPRPVQYAYYVPPRPTPPQPSGAPDIYESSKPDQAEPTEDEEPSPWALDVTATTIVPLSIGGQASLEIPGRIFFAGDIGWMPPGYGAAINGLVQSFGGYDPAIGSLVEGALDGALVARASAGWRPFPDWGFEISGGYTYIGLSGSLSLSDVAAASGNTAAAALAAQGYDAEVSIDSALHNFHLALGYRWVVWDHLLIRANIGYLQTVASSSSVAIAGHDDIAAAATGPVDEALSEVYESYVKLPFLALSGGYRF